MLKNINLSTCPLGDYPDLVREALAILHDKGQPWWIRSDAEHVIREASLQALPSLHPHLDELFDLDLHPTSATDSYPWRESGLLHFDFLKRVILDETKPRMERLRAWSNLTETRHPETFRFAENTSDAVGLNIEPHMRWVGYQKQGDLYKPLYTENPFYINFSGDYLAKIQQDRPWATEHPTWHLSVTDTTPHRFGGTVDSVCAVCGGNLHHLITLNPIPESLSISGLSSLTLAVCLSCLGWNWEIYQYLFYEHDANGYPRSIGYDGQRIEPEFPADGIQDTTVQLAEGGARWRWRDWGITNGANLHGVGGFPSWVQDDDYPVCIKCHQPMSFLIQLDSELPMPGNQKSYWEWGVGGLGYGFWCDDCRVSAYLLQHT